MTIQPAKKPLKRSFVGILESRLAESSPLIQVILGPRQVGKTTGVQMLSGFKDQIHYTTADDTLSETADWITEQWQAAKLQSDSPILIIDEIQKVTHWSERIKALWDEERRKKGSLKLVLLGSSSLSLNRGLDESLAGRFEVIPVHHWSFLESQKQFEFSVDDYLLYGGYPAAARFTDDFRRWQVYLKSSIIETVVGKDILRQTNVRNPALFRQAFELLSAYPAQEVSYTKLLGQLQDKGNTDLIRHYIELFEAAFLFKSIQKYSGSVIKQRSSSPKIFPLCPSLYSYRLGAKDLLAPELKGRVFEAVVGAELAKLPGELFYWKGKAELDFVYIHGREILAIEVKSGREKSAKGLAEFQTKYPKAKPVFITFENFTQFSKDPIRFFERLL